MASTTTRDGRAHAPYGGLFAVWFPWILLGSMLAATAALTLSAKTEAEAKAQAAFERRCSVIQSAIAERLRTYEQILRGAVALFISDEVGEGDWTRYVQTLQLPQRYPGMRTIGFAELVSREQLASFVARARREISADYKVFPPGERDEYAPVTYFTHLAGGKPLAVGFDMLSEPIRFAAMEEARRSGKPSISAKALLLDNNPAGFFMFVPVAQRDPRGGTLAQPGTLGFLYGAFQVKDLVGGVIGHDLPDVDLRIYDGVEPSAASLLYTDDAVARSMKSRYQPAFAATRTLDINNHTWTIKFTSLPYRQAIAELYKPEVLALSGTMVSVLLFTMAIFLARTGKRAERLAVNMTAAVRASEAKFRSYVERAPVGVLVAETDGTVAECNPAVAELTGRASSDLPRTSLLDLASPDDKDHAACALRELARDGEIEAEWRLRRLDGALVWVLWRAVRLPGGRFLAFCQDITQRKLDADALRDSEARAQSANRMKSEFLASMSHELRTPLTSIRGFSELIERRSEVASLREQAAIIRRAAEHLTVLLNDILDMSKIEAGAMQIARKPVSVRKLVVDTAELFRSAAEAKGLALNLAIGGDVPETAAWDALRVKQVLNNLLSNAIKFTAKGWVRLDVNATDGQVRMDVSDSGPGIAPDAQSLVFERFRQADASVSHQHGGTGLGLAVARSLAELMGGRLDLRSEPGRGCCFTFLLPWGLGPEEASRDLSSTSGTTVSGLAAVS